MYHNAVDLLRVKEDDASAASNTKSGAEWSLTLRRQLTWIVIIGLLALMIVRLVRFIHRPAETYVAEGMNLLKPKNA